MSRRLRILGIAFVLIAAPAAGQPSSPTRAAIEDLPAIATDAPPSPLGFPSPPPLTDAASLPRLPAPIGPPAQFAAAPAAAMPTPGAAFDVRLARAPKMMGDFFSASFGTASVGRFVGSGLFNSDFRLQLLSTSGPQFPAQVPFAEGPGSTFDPPVIDPGATVEGLSLTDDQAARFVAAQTGDVVVGFIDANQNELFDAGEPTVVGNVYDVSEVLTAVAVAASPGDLIGRTRVYENNSAWPQNRVYFDYSYFHNAAVTPSGVGVDRFAPGFERTFADGLGSFEVRVPMGLTLSSASAIDGSLAPDQFEMGNVALITKVLLASGGGWATAAGVGVAIPTADDFVLTSGGATVLTVQNESIHVAPFLAAQYASADTGEFAHAFLSFDFDASGNPTAGDVTGLGLTPIGVWQDQHLVSVNAAYGRWFYEAMSASERLQGLAWSAELHYTATLGDADVIDAFGYALGDADAAVSVLNATFGGHARIGSTTFTTGYAAPLTSDDRLFDGELRAFANRAF